MTEATATARLRVVADTDASRAPGGPDDGLCPQTRPASQGGGTIHLHGDKNPDAERGSQPAEISTEKISPKRPPGRPKGSRNRVTKDVRELLATKGLPAIETLCRIAAGRPVFRMLKGGARERIDPDLSQIMEAAKIVADKLLPTLKASDVKSDITSRRDDAEPRHPRDVARAIIASLRQGADGDDGDDEGNSRVFAPDIDDEESGGLRFPPASRTRSSGSQGRSAASEIEEFESTDLASLVGGRRTGSVATRKATESDAEIEMVGTSGAYIALRRRETDRELWSVNDAAGISYGSEWSREAARRKAQVLVEQRRI